MARIQPVILSGGSGSRLWPVSRTMLPKQLLKLVGDQTMLQATAARLDGFADKAADCLVVCNEAHRFMAGQQLAAIGVPARFILEPEGRNTAPAVALAALAAPDSLLLVMPADHVIRDVAAFHAAITEGAKAAGQGKLVTFGIVPTGPETGYGYIEAEPAGAAAVPVLRFVEKPDRETAQSYVDGGRHFWNSGMFLLSAMAYLDELGRHAPDMLEGCRKAMAAADTAAEFIRPDAAAFAACPSDSIDYAVMEKTDNAMVVPLDAGWSDVGSWAALHEVSERDERNNVVSGDTLLHDCRDIYVSAESRLVAAAGSAVL